MKAFFLTCSLCLWLVSPASASEPCPMDQGAWVYSQCVDESFNGKQPDITFDMHDSEESEPPLSGVSRRDGSLGYSQWSNGVTGTSQRLENYTYYNFSDGTRCTSTTISGYVYTNCQ